MAIGVICLLAGLITFGAFVLPPLVRVALGVVGGVGLILGGRLFRSMALQLRPAAAERRCPQCDYELRGVEGIHCPECGMVRPAAIDSDVAQDPG